MNANKGLEASQPATLEAVLEAIASLGARDEAEILALVSRGQLRKAFPFRPRRPDRAVADFADEETLVEASAVSLSPRARARLIQSSMPGSAAAPAAFETLGGTGSMQELLDAFRALERDGAGR